MKYTSIKAETEVVYFVEKPVVEANVLEEVLVEMRRFELKLAKHPEEIQMNPKTYHLLRMNPELIKHSTYTDKLDSMLFGMEITINNQIPDNMVIPMKRDYMGTVDMMINGDAIKFFDPRYNSNR